MERNLLLLQILKRLAELEQYRNEEYVVGTQDIDLEIKALRLKYQDVMNSSCPLIKDGK